MLETHSNTHLENKTLYASIGISFLIVMIMLIIGYIIESLKKKSSTKEDKSSQYIYPKEYVEFRPSIHC